MKRKLAGFAIGKSWAKVITAPKTSHRISRLSGDGAYGKNVMKGMVPNTLVVFIGLFLASVNVGAVQAEDRAEASCRRAGAEAQVTEVRIGYLRAYAPQLALSVLDVPPRDDGVAGANVAIGDNNTTGNFLGQKFTLDVTEVKPDAEVVSSSSRWSPRATATCSPTFPPTQLLSIADIARDKGVLLFNVGATDDILREEECRIERLPHRADAHHARRRAGAVSHLEAMAAAGYCIYGSHERDQLFADALRRAATRFGGEIVAEKRVQGHRHGTADRYRASSRSSGRCRSSRRTCPITTSCSSPTRARCSAPTCRSAPGSRGRSPARPGWSRRPGIRPASNGAASQIQNRFEKATGRRMLSKDMSAWTAVRIVGDAATRTHGADPAKIEAFIRGRRLLDRRLQGPEADLPPLELAVAAADLPRRRPRRSSRPRRRRASCIRSPSSTRSGSTSRRRNAC